MPYDADLADRVRAFLPAGTIEIPMFGALCFTIGGHMVVGVTREDVMFPVGRDGMAEAVGRGAREMQMGRRTMTGFAGLTQPSDDDLAAWMPERVAWALQQPPKKPKPPKKGQDGTDG
ncbi:MAG: hypothetical protein QM607_08560 [Microbacterium sp.]